MEAVTKSFGKMCKSMGKAIDRWGVSMQGKLAVKEERISFPPFCHFVVLPSARVLNYGSACPCACNAAYVATTATVSGDVCLGTQSSIGYGSVLRGILLLYLFILADLAGIKVGESSHIKDNVSIHVDYNLPTTIGNNVVIDNGSIIHACTIDDNCLIGEGVTVLDSAHICEGAAIAPGSVVTPRKTVGSGEVLSVCMLSLGLGRYSRSQDPRLDRRREDRDCRHVQAFDSGTSYFSPQPLVRRGSSPGDLEDLRRALG